MGFAFHIDCNSFYASCEVSLRPELKGRPVVVANYNEAGGGIILALSKEAKALGLKRGNPVFQVKEVLKKNGVAVFPANLTKYVDMSKRIMQVVTDLDLVTDFHQYSVDEFFAQLPYDDKECLRATAAEIKEAIEHGTGIPVSCGIAKTYTLAKVATWFAKRYDGYRGICVLEPKNVETALRRLPIGDVWGVGWRSAPTMEGLGIKTAWDFTQRSKVFVQSHFRITGVRTWLELRGTPAVDLSVPPKQQTIMHSRTFTFMTDDGERLAAYIANYAVAAARKLRDQHSVCRTVTVFVNTNRHREDLEQYSSAFSVRLLTTTADSSAIVKAAHQALDAIFRPHIMYKRAGVLLADIAPDNAIEQNLFQTESNNPRRSRRLMAATDSINTRYGMNKIRLASQDIEREEHEKVIDDIGFEALRNQTTDIDDVIEVK